MAKGLDCGTSYYITATEDSIKKQRNVFLTVDGDVGQVKRMLKRQRIPFVEKAGKVHIVGQHAFNYAQIFSTTELKRPMASGLLNPKERDALPVLNAIVGELLGKSKGKETCVYCIPAKPIKSATIAFNTGNASLSFGFSNPLDIGLFKSVVENICA